MEVFMAVCFQVVSTLGRKGVGVEEIRLRRRGNSRGIRYPGYVATRCFDDRCVSRLYRPTVETPTAWRAWTRHLL